MSILNYFNDLKLTTDQENAIEKIEQFLHSDKHIFILKGYAGSGKTTIIKGIVKYLQENKKLVKLLAPTGRAAKIITDKIGIKATSIHKGIYSLDLIDEEESSDNTPKPDDFLFSYKIYSNVDAYRTIFIVDESSMISDKLSQDEFFKFGSGFLLTDLIKYSNIEADKGSKIIFVGDPAQLPPVNMNFSPALESSYLEEKFNLKVQSTEIKEVVRQNTSSNVLKSATHLRNSLIEETFNYFNLQENNTDIFNPTYDDFYTYYSSVKNKTIICYKNKTAIDLNNYIRKNKFGVPPNAPIQKGDWVIIGTNNYNLDIMNGEFGVVNDVSNTTESREVIFRDKDGKTKREILTWRKIELILNNENGTNVVSSYMLENFLLQEQLTREQRIATFVDFKNRYPKLKSNPELFKETIKKDPYFNAIQLKYGYAITCHKAQGGEWNNVFLFWDKGVRDSFNFYENTHNISGKSNSDFYRWAYTAITRTSKNLYCINPPYFSPFSSMSFVDINIQQTLEELLPQKKVIFINDELQYLFENKNITDVAFKEHFAKVWYLLKQNNIAIMDYEIIGYEVRYFVKRDNYNAGFKFWFNNKKEFKTNFQDIPKKTNSNEFYKEIEKLLLKIDSVEVEKTEQVPFDNIEFTFKNSTLNILFQKIKELLPPDIQVENIERLNFKERYIFRKNSKVAVIDFEYNGSGFFGRVLPLENKSESIEIINKIKEIILSIKK